MSLAQGFQTELENSFEHPFFDVCIYTPGICHIEYCVFSVNKSYYIFGTQIAYRLVHIYITNALDNKDLIIYGNPKTKTLDFTHIDDFIQGVLLALNGSWNKEYNLSGESEYNIYRLAEFIIEKTGSKSQIKVYDAEKAQPQIVKLDISDIKALGYKPKYSVEEGVLQTIEWYEELLKPEISS